MGQAKQRAKRFGEQVRAPLGYRVAPCLVCFDGQPSAEMLIEIAFLQFARGFYRTTETVASAEKALERLKSIEVPESSVVLLDCDTLERVAQVSQESLAQDYDRVVGYEHLVCPRGGEVVEVGISVGSTFVAAGKGAIEPVPFFADKVRVVRGGVMPAYLPFAVQIAGLAMAGADDDGDVPEHAAEHALQQYRALQGAIGDMPLSVHADFMIMFLFETGEDIFDEDSDDHPIINIMSMLGRLAKDLELPPVLADYCRNEGTGHWIMRPRHADDVQVWEDFENDVLGLSANMTSEIRIGEEAWRGSFSIDHAMEAGRREAVDNFYRFFDRGELLHHVDLPGDIRVDLFDIEDMRFLVKTIPDSFAEVVAWKKGDGAIDAATSKIEGEEVASWASYRFVPADMTRPEMMRLQMTKEMAMDPVSIRQLVSNMHGFDSWRELERAVEAGPASPMDEDLTAAEVGERRKMAIDRTVEKCDLDRRFVSDMFSHLRPTTAKGQPSLKNYSDGPRLFNGPEDSLHEFTKAAASLHGLDPDAEDVEDQVRSSQAVHPSGWVGILEDFGWEIDDVDLSDDGEVIGPDHTYFGSVATRNGDFSMYLVPFLTFPDDNGDELLESIMEEIEDFGEPALLFQNRVLFAGDDDKGHLYGGRAWDGESWWQFAIAPGKGPDDVLSQKGKDIETLGRRARDQAFEGAKRHAIALQVMLSGLSAENEGYAVSFINHKSGWTQPMVMGAEQAELLRTIQESR